ncbi:MAG: hypothetical protein V3T86_11570 [Planctomycetota bacterium]
MRIVFIVLLIAGALPADEIHFRGRGGAIKDVKVLSQTDTEILYLARTMKKQKMPASMVSRVVKKRSTIHEFEDGVKAAKTADSMMEVAAWAAKKKFHKRVLVDLHQRALKLDPNHGGANTALGRVQYNGEWMTPAERDKRSAGDEEAAMRAKGLVRFEDRWVTPDDKAKLDQGLEKYEGRWMTPEEVKSAQGYVKHEGKWVKKDMLEILKLRGWGEKATGLGKALKLHQTANYAVFGDLQDSEIQVIAKTMEKAFAEWCRLFPSARDSDILAGKHRIYVFRKNPPYKKLVRYLYNHQRRTEKWSADRAKNEKLRMNLKQRETSFWEVQPEAFSAHVQMPDPFEGLKSHVVHFGGNVLATRHVSVRFPTWWLSEGVAYYLEKRVTGTIQTFNTDVGGAGGYADKGPIENNKANPWLDGTKWPELLANLVRGGRDPLLDKFKGKTLWGSKNRLNARELAKSWSLVTYMIESDKKKFAAFFEDSKTGPGETDVEREVGAMLKHYGSHRKLEEKWRNYARNGFRLAR